MDKYKFDTVRYCQANMNRMGVMPTGQAVGALIIGEVSELRSRYDALLARHNSLVEAIGSYQAARAEVERLLQENKQ